MDYSSKVRRLKYLVEKEADLPMGAIDSRRRTPDYCRARQVFCCFMLVDIEIGYASLSKHIDRHRTSLYFYEKEHERYMSDARVYPQYNKLYNKVKEEYWKSLDYVYEDNPLGVLSELNDIDIKIADLSRKKELLNNEFNAMSNGENNS